MLNRKTFFIREHVGLIKLSNTYDILDPESEGRLGIAQERPGGFVHMLRLLVSKQHLPTKVFVYEGNDPKDESRLIFSIQRGFTLFRSKVRICDAQGNVLGGLKSKLFSLGGPRQGVVHLRRQLCHRPHAGTKAVGGHPAPRGRSGRGYRLQRELVDLTSPSVCGRTRTHHLTRAIRTKRNTHDRGSVFRQRHPHHSPAHQRCR